MGNTLQNIVKCKEMRWGIRAAAVTSPCSALAPSLENVPTMSGTSVLHAGYVKHCCRLERVFASCRKRTRRGPDYPETPDVSASGLISKELWTVKWHIEMTAADAEVLLTAQSQGWGKVVLHHSEQP